VFNPELRKKLGVWYTPEEIARYQVERMHAALRSELGLADGLADPKVTVLDFCCGTGAYLRAFLRRMAATLHDKGGDALVANDLKKAAMERVFGFEILSAPFVIAHLQLGLGLATQGPPLSDRSDPPQRAEVYLPFSFRTDRAVAPSLWFSTWLNHWIPLSSGNMYAPFRSLVYGAVRPQRAGSLRPGTPGKAPGV
jgi:hypothetical protein